MQPVGSHINFSAQPHNLLVANKKWCVRSYRFGFNGQEKDDEVYGSTGTSYTAQFWQYDPRIGRRWNLDPKPTVGISDYACFADNPIWFSDPLGNSATVFITADEDKGGNEKTNTSAFNQLKSSTNLKLKRDDKSGQISIIGGKVKNEDDKKL